MKFLIFYIFLAFSIQTKGQSSSDINEICNFLQGWVKMFSCTEQYMIDNNKEEIMKCQNQYLTVDQPTDNAVFDDLTADVVIQCSVVKGAPASEQEEAIRCIKVKADDFIGRECG